MKIGIIGAGNVGTAVGRASVRAGHEVAISAGEPAEAVRVAKEVGARPAKTNADAAANAEVVVLAVPYDAIEEILGELGGSVRDKVIIDVSNRFDGNELGAPSNAEQIQKMTDAPVVKAFNTIFASHRDDPRVDGLELDGFVAGDDAEAKKAALSLMESLGFRPIDAGPLAMARALEGMGTLNIALNAQNRWPWQTGWKLVGPTA